VVVEGRGHLLACKGVDDASVGEVGEAGGCEAPVGEVDVVFEGVEGCIGAGWVLGGVCCR
jgi:hypothetical protein